MSTHLLRKIGATILITALCSCQPQSEDLVDEGTVKGKTYKNEEIGWTMKLPEDWQVELKKSREEFINKGKNIIEKNGVSLDMSEMKILINFKKNEFNNFQSTSEFTGNWTIEEWEENNLFVKELVFDALQNEGIQCDTSSYVKTIDGLQFNIFHTKIYAPNGQLILEQDMCSRMINGYDFGATMSYNNEKDKSTLWRYFLSSKFTFRNQEFQG